MQKGDDANNLKAGVRSAGMCKPVCVKLVSAMKKASVALLAVWLIWCGLLSSQEYEEAYTLRFVILKDDNGKPIRNASVVLHPVGKNGKQQRGGLELKADAEGRAAYDGIPYGKLRVQVLANGFQTFGQDYEVD